LRRTIPILRGLAILGVLFNHANWHALSQLPPGDPRGYPFIIFDQVGKFAIPAFMLIAGYFTAYAAGGGKRDLPRSVVRARLLNLLWPWLIWAAILALGQALQGQPLSPAAYLRTLFIHYYFIPLLMTYYLLAPWIVRLARRAPRRLLSAAALTQLLAVGLFYLRVYHPTFPAALVPWIDLGPLQYLRFALYFPLGLIIGIHPRRTKSLTARLKPLLPWLTALGFVLATAEAALAYTRGGPAWPVGGDQTKLTSALFSLALLLTFAAYDRLTLPYAAAIKKLGSRSYGLYLCHYPILGLSAKLIHRLTPALAAHRWLLFPTLFAVTLALSMLLMETVSRLPAKRFYHYLFG